MVTAQHHHGHEHHHYPKTIEYSVYHQGQHIHVTHLEPHGQLIQKGCDCESGKGHGSVSHTSSFPNYKDVIGLGHHHSSSGRAAAAAAASSNQVPATSSSQAGTGPEDQMDYESRYAPVMLPSQAGSIDGPQEIYIDSAGEEKRNSPPINNKKQINS